MEDIKRLVAFLAHTSQGVAELHFAPFDEKGETRVGYFDNYEKLFDTIEDYAEAGRLSIGVQPRPRELLAQAPNKLRPRVQPAVESDITHFLTAVINVYLPDDGEVDSSTIAEMMVQRVGYNAMSWYGKDGNCQLFFAVPAITLQNREELQEQLTQYGTRLKAAQEHADADIQARASLTDMIPLDGTVLHAIQRTELPKLGALLHRTIPPAVTALLNRARGGKASKLFRGEGPIGVDGYGNDIETTPEAYDRAFVEHLINKVKDITRDDLVNSLWNRPGSPAKADGIDSVYGVVDAALDAAHAAKPAAPQPQNNNPPPRSGRPPRPSTTFSPDKPLADRLYDFYFEFSDRAQRVVWIADVEITVKAGIVVQYLVDQGAEFYHFKTSEETVFVLDGLQYSVDVRDPTYQAWFTTNVQLFGPQSPRGRELTSAIRVIIESHENCHKPDNSNWGHFDREAGTLYYCFDPEHAEIVRIRPAEGAKPRVDVVPNGTDGVTLRGPMGRIRRFKYVKGALREGFSMFKREVHDGQALGEIDRLMSTVFNFATLLPDARQRPIKFHQGAAGSGKTWAGYDWQNVIYGRRYSSEYNKIPELLHAIKHAGPVITQDNAEASTRRRFHNVYLVASTGSTHTLRKFYTESSHAVYEPNGTLCISAIEPMTKSEEIRRAFEFKFSKAFHATREEDTDDDREGRIQENADLMLSGLFEAFSIYVLPDWKRRHAASVKFIKTECAKTSKSAFDGWLGWMLHFIESLGRYLWNPMRGGRPFDAHGVFQQYLEDMSINEKGARMEGDNALSCLDSLKQEGVAKITDVFNYDYASTEHHIYIYGVRVHWHPTGTVTIGPVTTSMLFKAFSGICKATGTRLQYEHGRALGARLAALAEDPAFSEMGWRRETLQGRAHGNNYRYKYVFELEEPLVPTPKPGDIIDVPAAPKGALGGELDDDEEGMVWDVEPAIAASPPPLPAKADDESAKSGS